MEKRQTIRAAGKRKPPVAGDTLYLFTGMRGAGCTRLATVVCLSVEQIRVNAREKTVSMVRQGQVPFWHEIEREEVEAIALADGFHNVDDFFEFFAKQYGNGINGVLIKW
ncbi:hypothetical protein [Eoetvoesiella caeni]